MTGDRPDESAGHAVLVTDRLRLRPLGPGDAEAWHRTVFADPEVMRFLPPGEPLPLDRIVDAVPRSVRHWEERGYGLWVVADRETGEFLGHCGLRYLDEIGEVEILYAYGRSVWGRGVATEAARAVVRYGFDRAGLDRIVAFAVPANRASTRVMEKIGMRHEGEQHIFDLDTVRYGLARADAAG